MAVWTLGSINLDHFYSVPHLPAPGETLAATGHMTGLGGKGANQSVAAARAGATVHHIGAVGPDGGWARDRLAGFGVDVAHVATVEAPTAHAIINVDPAGENAIVIFPGANAQQSAERIKAALAGAASGDLMLLQNETSHQPQAARLARAQGLRVVYSAAPFDSGAVQAMLPVTDILVMNAVEATQLQAALGVALADLQVPDIVITRGAKGAEWHRRGADPVTAPAFRVTPADTTGAGDCFTGSLAAALDAGMDRAAAMRFAAAAAALQVTRPGTAEAMPTRPEVDAFLKEHP